MWKIWSQESKKLGRSERKCRSGRYLSTLPLRGSTMCSKWSEIRESKRPNFSAIWWRDVQMSPKRCHRCHAHHCSFILRSIIQDWVVYSFVIACFAVNPPTVTVAVPLIALCSWQIPVRELRKRDISFFLNKKLQGFILASNPAPPGSSYWVTRKGPGGQYK